MHYFCQDMPLEYINSCENGFVSALEKLFLNRIK
jgi:hypothetical protein